MAAATLIRQLWLQCIDRPVARREPWVVHAIAANDLDCRVIAKARQKVRTMDRELTLDELLNEPIVRLLMSRDGVEEHEVRALVEALHRRTAADHDMSVARFELT